MESFENFSCTVQGVVGLDVHDVGGEAGGGGPALLPGMIVTVEPDCTLPHGGRTPIFRRNIPE